MPSTRKNKKKEIFNKTSITIYKWSRYQCLYITRGLWYLSLPDQRLKPYTPQWKLSVNPWTRDFTWGPALGAWSLSRWTIWDVSTFPLSK